MFTIKQLKAVNTLDDLRVVAHEHDMTLLYDIGGRCQHIAFYASDVALEMGIDAGQLPNKVGAYSNYLGGGIRGAICVTETHRVSDNIKRGLVDELSEACRRALINAERDLYDDDDDDAYWNRLGTEAARRAGIVSAY